MRASVRAIRQEVGDGTHCGELGFKVDIADFGCGQRASGPLAFFQASRPPPM